MLASLLFFRFKITVVRARLRAYTAYTVVKVSDSLFFSWFFLTTALNDERIRFTVRERLRAYTTMNVSDSLFL